MNFEKQTNSLGRIFICTILGTLLVHIAKTFLIFLGFASYCSLETSVCYFSPAIFALSIFMISLINVLVFGILLGLILKAAELVMPRSLKNSERFLIGASTLFLPTLICLLVFKFPDETAIFNFGLISILALVVPDFGIITGGLPAWMTKLPKNKDSSRKEPQVYNKSISELENHL